ncbi:hypothetical protein A7A08_01729 [Methyloligella halotolerans]|uniref:Lipoprotein n=1 Tax=Methyloligella halotolerans TaxID=1177755 RepID=A0A1E2RZP6_9HYPH|nr:hypothetical protein [Methyloligella halotolerans]ODA67694.1 hypothetical protein A7A08_01729 [Methyloligella halotolerans]
MLTAIPMVVLLGCSALAAQSPGPCAFADLEPCLRRAEQLQRFFKLPEPMTCQIQVASGGLPA